MGARQFLKEFGHIANAPGGVNRLRELILVFGVSGRLGTTISNERVDNLLIDIKGQINKQAEDRNIRRKKYQGAYAFKFPLNIPDNWSLEKLNDFALINMGQSPDSNSVSNIPNSGIPFYQGKTEFGILNPVPRKWCDDPKKIAISGDVLISVRAPVGPTNMAENESCIGRGITGITPLCGVDSKYIFYVFRALEKQISSLGVGTTFVAISLKDIQAIPIPVPPIEEQQRIVAKVDELMKLCDKLETQQQKRNKLKKLTRTTLLDALGNAQSPSELKTAWQRVQEALAYLYTDPEDIWLIKQTIIDLAMSGYLIENSEKSKNTGSALLDDIEQSRLAWETESKDQELKEAQTMRKKLKKQKYNIPKRLLPKNWAWGSFLQISQTVVDCHNKTAPYVLKGVHLIRTTDIRNGKMDLRNTKKITEETYEYWARRMPPKEGDIFFTREAPMGEAAIVPSGDKVCLGQRTLLIRLFPEYFDNEFLLYAIYSPSFIARMEGMGVGATVKHLRVGDVEALIVPVPPIDEQRIIVKKLKQLLSVCDDLEKKLVTERRISKILAQASIAALTETGQPLKDKLQNMEVV